VLLDKLLLVEFDNVEVLYLKAIILNDLQRYDETIEYYDKFLAIDPTDVDGLLNKGSILDGINKHDEG